jgi:hypothetical protein
MKKLLYTLTLSTILCSCGGGGGDTPPPVTVNHAPSVPTLVSPVNNLLCIDNPVECKWIASTDSDGDAVTYQIEVAQNSTFTLDKQTFNGTNLVQSVPLVQDVAYYWRVKATDSNNASSSYSSVYKFYTYGEGVTNHLPFSPALVSPAINGIVKTTTASLQWTASDVDTADTLTFDVYFGTVNPPTSNELKPENSNLSSNSLSVNLAASTTYYWKVVVKDGKGGQTIGQTWSFKTD